MAGKLGFVRRLLAQVPGGTLPPSAVPKFMAPLVKPPVFPAAGRITAAGMKNAEYYEIAMRQFRQQILPAGLPQTTVWSYGPADATTFDLANRFFYPAFSFESRWQKPAVVKWVNGLVDANGNPLPHLLPVDPSLHWASPIGTRDSRPARNPLDPYWASQWIDNDGKYVGPVPMVTHLHGGHSPQESDGYPEAWYLPAGATGVDSTTGTWFDQFNPGDGSFGPGYATFGYPNDQDATTLWYHDHSLGITRLNVYAGPAGFYLLRGGPSDQVLDSRNGRPATLPGPAPGPGIDPFGTFYEIPIVIQDRSFNADGSLYYPDNRAFFEGLDPSQLQIPFIPNAGCSGPSDVPPIWQPEFFGNMMVVNGQTWPVLDVEQRRYRFRLLNGCNSRFLILDFSDVPGAEVWQIGADGGFLPAPVNITAVQGNRLLMGPAERADVIVDFTNARQGTWVLRNVGPDEPFGGGVPGVDFDPADPNSTGQVMALRVGPSRGADQTTPPNRLIMPALATLGPGTIRQVSLNEEESKTVEVTEAGGGIVLSCGDPGAAPFGPTAALLGTVNGDGSGNALLWGDATTETPGLGDTETWEIRNGTEDAHPIHIHLVQFQVVGREAIGGGPSAAGSNAPLPTETGYKDTVIAYPGEVTRVKARFDRPGLFVWHCHILEHEDNEMMRPYRVGAP